MFNVGKRIIVSFVSISFFNYVRLCHVFCILSLVEFVSFYGVVSKDAGSYVDFNWPAQIVLIDPRGNVGFGSEQRRTILGASFVEHWGLCLPA